ncbi:MAG TPA: PaaI family thioesterase [Bacillales bacterium]|nr:PaaI family thioesterase [Bacillales bacterium]
MEMETEMIVEDEVLTSRGVDYETFKKQTASLIENTLIGLLDIELVEIAKDRLVMKMPVGPKTQQPAGILHGGASVVLAETAATMATSVNIDIDKFAPVGMEINANHIRSKKDGVVTALATPLHRGRTSMVWDIKITDEEGKLICVSRCTMAVIRKR